MAIKVKILLAARLMNIKDLIKKVVTSSQNSIVKLRKDNLSENYLIEIEKVCNAFFEDCFTLNDTGKEK